MSHHIAANCACDHLLDIEPCGLLRGVGARSASDLIRACTGEVAALEKWHLCARFGVGGEIYLPARLEREEGEEAADQYVHILVSEVTAADELGVLGRVVEDRDFSVKLDWTMSGIATVGWTQNLFESAPSHNQIPGQFNSP